MPDSAPHPSSEQLAAYGLGQLPPDQATLVEQHITECEPCCETIFDLSSSDTFVDLLCKAKHAPTEQTHDHFGLAPKQTSAEAPAQLAEHSRYEMIGLIGKGGMGDVYEARHRKMNRTVALKVINSEFVRKPDAIDRFHREVKTAAQLSHPNIVTAHDADNAGDYHFMVMEFVDGVDLSRTIKDRGALPVAEACDYIRQAAIGLQHAHDQGMVHRDIKPHNLMLTADGTVKILDFGLASLAPNALADAEAVEGRGDLTAAGAIMGTPDFISPEQANDARQADIRSDIYSLGATLYCLLSGRPPFEHGSVTQKLRSHAQDDAEPLESLREDIPAELAAVVSKMMAKNPNDRFQTPVEVVDALLPYLQATAPERKQSLPSPVQPVRSRSRFLLLTAVATLMLAALAAGVVFYLQTGNGTIRVALMDDSLEATINGQRIQVKDGDKEFEIRAGLQQLRIRQKDSDAEFATDNFRIWRNDVVRIEVRLLIGEVVVKKDGEFFDRDKGNWMPPVVAESPSNDPVPRVTELWNALHEPDRAAKADPRAKAALKRAQRLEEQGEFGKAADAYLEAYRLGPSLLAYDQFATIKKANRTREFVEVFTVDRLKRVPFLKQPAVSIVRDLLQDDATCLDGNVFLRNMWEAKPYETTHLLGYRADEIWSNVIDTTLLIRDRVLPADIPSEGAGWDRFTIDSIGDRGGTGFGVPQILRPLFKNTPQQMDALRKLAREVEAKTQQFPGWKAGVAILGFLEAEVGNEKRAVELFEKVLADSTGPIPAKSAWVFGLALEGKSVALDQMVMRLFERNLTESYLPSTALNVSSIASLARLYAKYNRRDEARQLLLRLSEPQGPGVDDETQFVTCRYGRKLFRETESGWTVLSEDQVPQSNCKQCHQKERNLENYLLMANSLTDVGYPVEARLTLGRIGASFYNAYGSDEDWAKANTSVSDWEYQGEEAFQPATAKAENAITPQALLKALESGVSIDSDLKNPVIAEAASRIDLMLGVRGENAKSTLFSPVIDMFEIAARAKGDEAAIAIVQIDQLLAEAFDKKPEDLELGVAATVFAFLRDDLDAAERRLQKLQTPLPNEELQLDAVGLWLVARLARTHERTREIGRQLTDRAISAAEKQSGDLWKEAILQDRAIVALERAQRLAEQGEFGKSIVAYDEAYTLDPTLWLIEQGPWRVPHDGPAATVDPRVKVALKRALLLEEQGEFGKAADAYLEAYRLEPSLLAADHFATIKKAKRTREFVEVFTIDRLKRVPFAKQAASRIVRELLQDDATCLDGNVFLMNLWKAKPYESTFFLLRLPADEIWPNITNTALLIRERILPTDIPAEGAGWERFSIDTVGAKFGLGTGSGIPQILRPLFRNTPQQKDALRKLAREVEATTLQFPRWKAGVAILGFLEAELGNENRAVELFEDVLADSVDPMPSKSAWVFGLALEGKSVALDQIAMRLYERNLTKSYSPGTSSRSTSSIASLARLYAKYDRRDEARQLLLRLSEPQGPGADDKESQLLTCTPGNVLKRRTGSEWIVLSEAQVPNSNCTACHRKERNLNNYFLMANSLTDLGYPVDARLALARIGDSYYNAFGSDQAWALANTPNDRWSYYGKDTFQPLRAKAEGAITPQAFLKALKSGVFIDSDMKNPVIAEAASRIDLMLAVRGENGKSTLFSPVIDMLEIAAKAKGDDADIANAQIDQLLAEAFEESPADLELGIAATVFAFLRNDLAAGEKRLQKLRKGLPNKEIRKEEAGLWLVAREALQHQTTRAAGENLARRALAAARKQGHELWTDAIVQEREE